MQEHFTFDIHVQALEASGMTEAVETQIMPRVMSVIEDRRRGYTSRLKAALESS